MPRYIDAEDAVKVAIEECQEFLGIFDRIKKRLEAIPTADVVERRVGKWTEKEVIHAEEAKTAIEEWQSCRCSVCGRYDTRPYMYYFNNPNYCSWCGAEMKGEDKA